VKGACLVSRILLTYPADERPVRYGAALEGLRGLGEVVLNPHARTMTADEIAEAARGCDAIVTDRNTPFDAASLARLSSCRALVRAAMDVRNIDIAAASAAGILVTRAGPGFRDAVVELLLGQMIDLARGLSDGVIAYRAGRVPERRPGIQLAGRTASILGYGNLGRRMAEVLGFLGMRVLVHDPHVAAIAPPARGVGRDEALAEGDFVICLALHNAATDQSMNRDAFGRMKRSAFFLNPSRGRIVDEAALAEALRDGTIAGAALDVGSDPDDVPPVALGGLSNVVAAPHIGGMVPEALASQAQDTVEQVADILAGRMPRFALNPEAARRLTAGQRAP
jgi:D-3-phosphoglycerate dehydrogenase